VYLILLVFLGLLILAMRLDRHRIVALVGTVLTPYQRPETMTEDDLRMLGNLHERRLARQWARLHCGLSGSRTMADYQLAATELALSGDRAQQGIMMAEAFETTRGVRLAAMEQAAASLRSQQPPPPHPSWAPYGRPALAVTAPPSPPTRTARRPAANRMDDPGDD
jgi:protease PrsW